MLTQINDLRYSELIGRPIDNTALSAYMTCARKGLYSMFLNRRKAGPPTPALAYGSAWHVAMETHYRAQECTEQQLIEQVNEEVMLKWEDHCQEDDYRSLNRLLLEYKKYLSRYGLPWREEARTVGWPDSPLIEISTELAIPGARHPYAGKMDRIIQIHGQHLVEDHKTGSQMRSDFFKVFEMDNQMIGYAAMAQLLTGKPISGVRINAHICRKNDSVFERRTISFSQARLEAWMKNYDLLLIRMENDLALFQANPDLATTDAFPHNFSACSGKYGMCQYVNVCAMPPRLRQTVLEEDFQEVPWNPLEVKEDASE